MIYILYLYDGFIKTFGFIILCCLIGSFIDTYIRFISSRRSHWDPAALCE